MEQSLFEKGVEISKKVSDTFSDDLFQKYKDIVPDIHRLAMEFGFGEILSRDGLSLQQRELTTVAVLTAMGGCEPQLDLHIKGALNVGASDKEVVETIMQCLAYTGFPRVLNSLNVLQRILKERAR